MKSLEVDAIKIQIITERVKNNMVCIDAGACLGFFTHLLCYCAKSVIAFEPRSSSFDKLKKLELRYNNLVCENIALSNFNGYSNLSLPRKIGHSRLIKETDNIEEVQVVKLDDYCNISNIDIIHVLKMDVEGEDLRVIQGASKIIDKSKDLLLIAEIHYGRNVQREMVFAMLKNRGFKLYNLLDLKTEITDPKLLENEIVGIKNV